MCHRSNAVIIGNRAGLHIVLNQSFEDKKQIPCTSLILIIMTTIMTTMMMIMKFMHDINDLTLWDCFSSAVWQVVCDTFIIWTSPWKRRFPKCRIAASSVNKILVSFSENINTWDTKRTKIQAVKSVIAQLLSFDLFLCSLVS